MTNTMILKITEITSGDAFAISGGCFVFILLVLAALIGVIILLSICINWLANRINKTKAEKAAANATAQQTSSNNVVSAVSAEAKGSCGGINIYNVEPKDAAMVMAIVADELKMPLNRLKFKSIKLVGEVQNDEV